MPQKKRSDKIEYEKRIRAVQEWVINSYSYVDITNQIVQSWGVTDRQAKNYIQEAYKRFRDANEIDIEHLKAAAIERRKKLARELDSEFKKTPQGVVALLAVEKDIDKLRGLYVTKHEVSGHNGTPIPIETKTKIDYTKLPDEVLEIIANARRTVTED